MNLHLAGLVEVGLQLTAELARPVDLIWGDLQQIVVHGGAINLMQVFAVQCAGMPQAYLPDTLRPDPGDVDFFLFRESDGSDYGAGSSGLPRVDVVGACP